VYFLKIWTFCDIIEIIHYIPVTEGNYLSISYRNSYVQRITLINGDYRAKHVGVLRAIRTERLSLVSVRNADTL